MERSRLTSIQSLRGAAALSVVTFHTLGMAVAHGIQAPAAFGAFGVDLFFVISGFVVTLSADRNPSRSAFIAARLNRLVPLYWIATTAKVAAMLLLPAIGALQFSAPHALASYAFIPWADQSGQPHPVVYVGWTLVFEVWFYLAFAALRFRADLLALFFAAVVLAGTVEGSIIWNTFTDPMILEFVMGLAIGRASLGKDWRLAGIAAALVLAFPESRAFYWGVPAMAAVAFAVAAERHWRSGWLTRIGDTSYSLYLSHVFVLPAFFAIAAPYVYAPVAIIAALATCLAVAQIAHHCIERPLCRVKLKARTPLARATPHS